MIDGEKLWAEVLAICDDDSCWLAYADWLDERETDDDAERASEIRQTINSKIRPVKFETIIIDTREQKPFAFKDFVSDYAQKYAPIKVIAERGTLKSGDYSLAGYTDQIAIERKSLTDLYGTIGRNRDRFERELQRLSEMEFACVVIESDWDAIISQPPIHTRLNPKIIFRSVISWKLQYPTVHWWACPNRRFAETVTFRTLQRYQRMKTKGTQDT